MKAICDMARLNEDGFLIFRNAISPSSVSAGRVALQRMVAKVECGAYPFFRIYDDMLNLNLAGIERIFHPDIFEPAILQAVQESGLLRKSMEVLGTAAPAMNLNRVHLTGKYSHTGMWHRDAKPGIEDDVQMSLYFYPEDGLVVVPGSHRRPTTIEEDRRLKRSIKADLAGQMALRVGSGDLVIFRSAILHRGRSVGARANVFFRFDRRRPSPSCARAVAVADADWKSLLNNPERNCDFYANDNVPRRISITKRLLATVAHYAGFFLPESHPLFERFRWLTPNLRMK